VVVLALAGLLAALSLGLSQEPMIGVACPGPNVTTCGRVGIAIWLTRPARGVTAELAGARVRLHAGGFGGQGPTYWEGYARISQARLRLPVRWYGAKPVRVLNVQLSIRYRMRVASGTVRLQLRPGWG
jgi:hypothetical protein